jgi:hypothetical protein
MNRAVNTNNIGLSLVEFTPRGTRNIGVSADPELIRRVAAAMSVAYRGQMGAPGTPSGELDAARIRVLDSVASADFDEDEGEEIAKPWWESAFDNHEEVSQSQ